MYLIDTHILYWYINNDDRLSEDISHIISTQSGVYVSICSFWEMAIKNNIGKLTLPLPIKDIMSACEKNDISVLPIKAEHIELLSSLPFIHRDPFDRMLISQSIYEGLTLVTADENILKYTGVKLIKA